MKKDKITILAFIGLIFLIVSQIPSSDPIGTADSRVNESPPASDTRQSGHWTLSPFTIDELDDTKNWSHAEETYDWCSGSGTWADPYVIENITIDANGGDYGIVINNSKNVYFVIRNCTMLDTDDTMGAIFMRYTNNGTITRNNITDNTIGIKLEHCENNTIYYNNFTNNYYQAIDNLGSDNHWDNTTHGNYWEDYEGYDTDGDGIGETSYDIAGSTTGSLDAYPIWSIPDTDEPIVSINSPETDDLFGIWAPSYEVIISDYELNDTWYTFDGGVTNWTLDGQTGTFDQAAWNAVDNGSVLIEVYANDTSGNWGSDSVSVEKDKIPPQIQIMLPQNWTLYGNTPPTYQVAISDGNLDSMWYTINDGDQFNLTDVDGEINGTYWNAQSNGTVTIKFCANDTVGNAARNTSIVRRDIIAPNVTVQLPDNESIWNAWETRPSITASARDINGVDELWYGISWEFGSGIVSNFSLTNDTNQLIDSSAWNSIPVGRFFIHVFANDSVGNLNDTHVITLYKFGPFAVDGNHPQYNWAWLESLPWCSGSGTQSDPHVLEDLFIDGENSASSGITVEDSNVYFTINNCTILDTSGGGSFEAGITLLDTSNGIVVHNDITSNDNKGILIFGGHDNNVTGNNVTENTGRGIHMWETQDILVSSNNISSNGMSQIDVTGSHGIRIFNNIITGETGTAWDGVYMYLSQDNLIEQNIILNNSRGIRLYNADENTIHNNTIHNNTAHGIYLTEGSGDNLMQFNRITNNDEHGMIIEGYFTAKNYGNIAWNNTITNNGKVGVLLWGYSYEANISSNFIARNGEEGVKLYSQCNDNVISNNTLMNNQQHDIMIQGFYTGSLYYPCENVNITNNVIRSTRDDNQSTIFIIRSQDVTVLENDIQSDRENGVRLIHSPNCAVIRNVLCGADNGIHAFISSYVYLVDNDIRDAKRGIVMNVSLNVNVFQNSIHDNTMGLTSEGCTGFIQFNNISSNDQAGILINGTDYTIIRDNHVKGNYRGIYIIDNDNFNIADNDVIYNINDGIFIVNSTDGSISGCNCSFNGNNGMYLKNVNDTIITDSMANNCSSVGIYLEYGHGNEISECVVHGSYAGIGIVSSANNDVYENDACWNDIGIATEESRNDNIHDNIARENVLMGIGCAWSNYTTIIHNEVIENGDTGIYLWESLHCEVLENVVADGDGNGILVYHTNYTIIWNNTIRYNMENGIHITQESSYTEVSRNVIEYNSEYGVLVSSGVDNIIHGSIMQGGKSYIDNGVNTEWRWNWINGSVDPFIIDDTGELSWTRARDILAWCWGSGSASDPYRFTPFLCNASGTGSCITIQYTSDHFLLQDLELTGAGSIVSDAASNRADSAVYLWYAHNGRIEQCHIHDNNGYDGGNGIYVGESINVTIVDCDLVNNWYAINLGEDSDHANVIDCTLSEYEIGIFARWSDNSTITSNVVFGGSDGIYVWQCEGVNITENDVFNNQNDTLVFNAGIRIRDSRYCWIYDNHVTDNDIGIGLEESDNNTIEFNIVSFQLERGIFCYAGSSWNLILDNELESNAWYGIYMSSGGNNTIWGNYLGYNGLANAEDWGNAPNPSDNRWDNGEYGNYWEDYAGEDLNDDGIGDTPYFISGYSGMGNYDYMPIWWDGVDVAGEFNISTDAGDPDIDGDFTVNWTESENAVSYSIYIHDAYISEINGSVTEIDTGITALHYNLFNIDDGTWYVAVTAKGPTGLDTLSNNVLKIIVTNHPMPFTAWSNASDPDADGTFTIEWNASEHADNYSIYVHFNYITELNSSVTLLYDGITTTSVIIEDYDGGTFFFVVAAVNEHAATLSNNVIVFVGHSPDWFLLSYQADEPDTDGEFLLTWETSEGALYYNVYEDGKLIAENTTETEYLITNRRSGTYTYVIEAVNEHGSTTSNEVTVVVDISENVFELIWLWILEIIAFLMGLLGVAWVIKRRKKGRECNGMHCSL